MHRDLRYNRCRCITAWHAAYPLYCGGWPTLNIGEGGMPICGDLMGLINFDIFFTFRCDFFIHWGRGKTFQQKVIWKEKGKCVLFLILAYVGKKVVLTIVFLWTYFLIMVSLPCICNQNVLLRNHKLLRHKRTVDVIDIKPIRQPYASRI